MSRSILTAGLLLASKAIAQSPFAADGFTYVGCVEAPAQSFGMVIDFFAPFTPDQCQAACAGKATYAALGGGCQCDVPDKEGAVHFTVVDGARCDTSCIQGDPSQGFCGGASSGAKQLYNLYKVKKGGDAEERDGDMEGGCDEEEEEESAAANNKMVVAPKPSTIVKTVFSCPSEVTDCPYRTSTTPPVCPGGEGCPPPATTTTTPPPSPAPVFTKLPAGPCPPEPCMPACPPEGCPSCPPEGCLPACAADCPVIVTSSAMGLSFKRNSTSSSITLPTCPPGGCIIETTPAPTYAPSATPLPKTSTKTRMMNRASSLHPGGYVTMISLVAMVVGIIF